MWRNGYNSVHSCAQFCTKLCTTVHSDRCAQLCTIMHSSAQSGPEMFTALYTAVHITQVQRLSLSLIFALMAACYCLLLLGRCWHCCPVTGPVAGLQTEKIFESGDPIPDVVAETKGGKSVAIGSAIGMAVPLPGFVLVGAAAGGIAALPALQAKVSRYVADSVAWTIKIAARQSWEPAGRKIAEVSLHCSLLVFLIVAWFLSDILCSSANGNFLSSVGPQENVALRKTRVGSVRRWLDVML